MGGRPKGYTKETISKLLLLRNIYKDFTKRPEDIYNLFGLTRATFYRYAKILDHHTDEEIKNMGILKKTSILKYVVSEITLSKNRIFTERYT